MWLQALASALIALGQLPGHSVGNSAADSGILQALNHAYRLMDAIHSAEQQVLQIPACSNLRVAGNPQ